MSEPKHDCVASILVEVMMLERKIIAKPSEEEVKKLIDSKDECPICLQSYAGGGGESAEELPRSTVTSCVCSLLRE